MAANYLLPENDDLLARKSGAWAKDKLFFLQKYISAFETSMKGKPWRRRIYIDLFSGPGKCTTRENSEYFLGSPLISLTTQYPFTDYYFVDMDADNIHALRTRSTAAKVEQNRISYLGRGYKQKSF
jgi:three-Cys-motif partner protein